MKTLEGKINGKVVFEWDIPSRPEEVTYRQLVMFETAYQNFLNEKEKAKGPALLKAYTKVVAAFFDVGVEEVYKMPVNLYNDWEKEMTGLFLYLWEIMMSYKPALRTKDGQAHVFQYKGETWEIPWAVNVKEVDITYGQAIELLEIERKAQADKETRQDHDNIRYSSDLFKIACLAKQPGEELPESDVELQDLMKQRAEHFVDIDMVTMKDLLFFSTRGSRWLLRRRSFSGYGILQSLLSAKKVTLRAMISGSRLAS